MPETNRKVAVSDGGGAKPAFFAGTFVVVLTAVIFCAGPVLAQDEDAPRRRARGAAAPGIGYVPEVAPTVTAPRGALPDTTPGTPRRRGLPGVDTVPRDYIPSMGSDSGTQNQPASDPAKEAKTETGDKDTAQVRLGYIEKKKSRDAASAGDKTSSDCDDVGGLVQRMNCVAKRIGADAVRGGSSGSETEQEESSEARLKVTVTPELVSIDDGRAYKVTLDVGAQDMNVPQDLNPQSRRQALGDIAIVMARLRQWSNTLSAKDVEILKLQGYLTLALIAPFENLNKMRLLAPVYLTVRLRDKETDIRLRFVVWDQDGFLLTRLIPVGEPFWVEVLYGREPDEDIKTVRLKAGESDLAIEVARTPEESTLYRSQAFYAAGAAKETMGIATRPGETEAGESEVAEMGETEAAGLDETEAAGLDETEAAELDETEIAERDQTETAERDQTETAERDQTESAEPEIDTGTGVGGAGPNLAGLPLAKTPKNLDGGTGTSGIEIGDTGAGAGETGNITPEIDTGTGVDDAGSDFAGLPLPKTPKILGGGTGTSGIEIGDTGAGAGDTGTETPEIDTGIGIGGIEDGLDFAGTSGTGGDAGKAATDDGGAIVPKKESKGLIGGFNNDDTTEAELEIEPLQPLEPTEPGIGPPDTALPTTSIPMTVKPGIGIQPPGMVPPATSPPKTAAPGTGTRTPRTAKPGTGAGSPGTAPPAAAPPKTAAPGTGTRTPRTAMPGTGTGSPRTAPPAAAPPRTAMPGTGTGPPKTAPPPAPGRPATAAPTPELAMADPKAPGLPPPAWREDEQAGERALAQGNLEAAEGHFWAAIGIKKQDLGVDHLEMADSLIDIARVYQAQGRHKAAEPLLERALSIRENALGPDHLLVGAALNELSRFYTNRSRYKEAAKAARRDIEIYEKHLGSDRPTLGGLLLSYAKLLRKLGRDDEAEAAESRGRDIYARATPGSPPPASPEPTR